MTDPQLSAAQLRSIAQARGFINLWDGPIRAGKSIGSLIRWLHFIVSAPTGGSLLVVGKTTDTIWRNVWTPLMDPAIMGPVARQVRYTRGAPAGHILGREVEVISGSDASAESRLRGLTCAGWYGDEVSLLPETFFDQLIGRCSLEGAMGFGTTNPGAPNHWLRQRFLLKAWRRSTGVRAWHFTMDDNPSLTETFKNTLKSLYTGMWYKRMILGLWVMAEGAVFDGFDSDRHVVKTLPADIRWIGSGTDYGTTNPFAVVLLGIGTHPRTGRRALFITNEWRWDSKIKGRQLSDAQYSDEVTSWLAELEIAPGVKGIVPRWEIVDPSAASYRVERHNRGATTYPGDNGVEDGLRMLASLFARDQLVIHDSCTALLAELPGYSWDSGKAKLGRDEPIKEDDHSIDATRYVIRTTVNEWFHDLDYDLSLAAKGA